MTNGFEHKHKNEREHEREHERGHTHEHEYFKKHKKVCTVNTNEDITITTPVVVNAYTNTCNVELICNGHEIIRDPHCKPNTSKFKIQQKIRVCIPIEFVAECDIGNDHVDFDFD